MGIFKKHQGRGVRLLYFLHVHELSPWPSGTGTLCVRFERGARSGSTRGLAPVSSAGQAAYAFEEQLQLPATLYQDAAASKKGGGKGLGAFEAKMLQLLVVPADGRRKPSSGQPLGTVSLNLADYVATDGRTQEAFTVSGPGGRALVTAAGAPKLLLTIECRDVSRSKGSGPLAVGPSASSLVPGGLPTSLSTDYEDSQPSSRSDSRPASRADTVAGLQATSKLAVVQEETVLPAQTAPAAAAGAAAGAAADAGGSANDWGDQGIAEVLGAGLQQQAAAPELPELPPGPWYDEDGILIDEVEESMGAEPSLEPSASVRRNLGSALERAEASEAASGTLQAASSGAPPEVQSRLAAAVTASAAAGVSSFVIARLASGRGITLAVPSTPAEPLPAEPESPVPLSTGQQSSLSAVGDPAVPFTVPPTTQRRFAQRGGGGAAGNEAAGGATGRRWAWRCEGGSLNMAGSRTGAAAGANVSTFHRARVTSAAKHNAREAAASSAVSSSSAEACRRTTAEDQAAPAGALQLALQVQGSVGSESSLGLRSGSIDALPGPGAAHQSPLQLQRSMLGASGLLRPTLSVLESSALPSPSNLLGGAPSSLVVEALLLELRSLSALESAVYLAAGRKAIGGGSGRHLHTPARRLARTIISLGPQDGLAFGLQAISAVQAMAGSTSGDMHRLAFWWSNMLQLRCMFSTLCQGLDRQQALAGATPGLAGGGGAGGALVGGMTGACQLETQGSEQHLSSRAAFVVVAAAARGVSANRLDWMQALLPHLRDLEAWLFGEMLKHLWWHVLLHSVTAAAQRTNSDSSSRGAGAATGSAGGANELARSGRSVSRLAKSGSAGSDVTSPALRQGTPRSFETPEEEALHRWVEGLGAVERAIREPFRPAPAPSAHLTLLHRQVIGAVLRRLDTLLFRMLLVDEPLPPLRLLSMGGLDAFSRTAEADEVLGAGAESAAVGLLDATLLPFPRGALTFGTGVSLKMAVSRLNSWAADCGVKEDCLPQAGRSTEMSDYRLFPCLRATADLLMMPKEVLVDPQMRREVVPGLPLHRVCQLLERFEPDDNAPDPLSPGLLEALQSESPRSDCSSTPSPTAKPESEYLPPDEDTMLANGVIEPMSLEMDEGSDDELAALAYMHTVGGTGQLSPASSGVGTLVPGAADQLRVQRFALLRDLWAVTQ